MNEDWRRVFNEEKLLRDMARVRAQGGLDIPPVKKQGLIPAIARVLLSTVGKPQSETGESNGTF